GTGGTGGSGGTGGTGGSSGTGGTGGASGTGGTGASSGTGGTGGSSGTGGTGGSGSTCDYPNSCTAARDIGLVRGDKGSDVVTASGSSSEWLRLRVKEADDSMAGRELKVRITLRSPAPTNFDLYVYLDKDKDVVECSLLAASSVLPAEELDSANLNWGEAQIPNGKDDSRWVTIEVRHVSGPCSEQYSWEVTAKGN
ncbi:MAG TPA: hypothetical protein PLH51_21945, partial [Polyangiaceae bacterium]|nr:hypothetical protein [Polyangiaceae bacterium]